MIFVTVGHQMPFDRLVRAVDEWTERTGRADIFAQIGNTQQWPRYMQAAPFLTPQQFMERIQRASGIVGHAGTGTIIAALRLGKPLLVLPRRSDQGETRNDHQIATAKHFEQAGHVLAAYSEDELIERLGALEVFQPRCGIEPFAQPQLIERLREFTFGSSTAN